MTVNKTILPKMAMLVGAMLAGAGLVLPDLAWAAAPVPAATTVAPAASPAALPNNPSATQGESTTPAVTSSSSSHASNDRWHSVWHFVQGQQPATAVFLGMWSVHTNSHSRSTDNWNNQLVGISYHSIFVGTFVNSFYDRTEAFGVTRDVDRHAWSANASYALGYRLGGLYGYDGRMGEIASISPVIPFLQLYSDFTYRHMGLELSYTGVVFSAGFFVSF